ncbi:hypothetical protein [Peribacillus kribbensis]|uniref:hypothetical protein n=1 Tax=Peribacillus kribbensis TaxID=356658 RepID=UPI0003F50958|nr:hypothetical protein [Peribacillus kribbensis]
MENYEKKGKKMMKKERSESTVQSWEGTNPGCGPGGKTRRWGSGRKTGIMGTIGGMKTPFPFRGSPA